MKSVSIDGEIYKCERDGTVWNAYDKKGNSVPASNHLAVKKYFHVKESNFKVFTCGQQYIFNPSNV